MYIYMLYINTLFSPVKFVVAHVDLLTSDFCVYQVADMRGKSI